MYRKVLPAAAALAALAALAACRPPDTVADAPVVSASPSVVASHGPESSPAGTQDADGAASYVRQFRREFPDLADGKTDAQILADGEADCTDMAAGRVIVTPSMAKRYGLGESFTDKAVLYNVALLDMFALCPSS
jgi:hypothetical protein